MPSLFGSDQVNRADAPLRASVGARAGARQWLPLVLIFLVSLGVAAAANFRPRDSLRLAAVFPPWWSAARSLEAAASVGAVAGFGRLPFIVGVAARESDAVARLKSQGALVVLDGSKFSFCNPK